MPMTLSLDLSCIWPFDPHDKQNQGECGSLHALSHSSDILSIRFKHTRILRIFGFFLNTLKYFIQRPIFKPLYFYNDFFKILENTSF